MRRGLWGVRGESWLNNSGRSGIPALVENK